MKKNLLPLLILITAIIIIIIIIFSQNKGITNFAIKENNYSSNLILDIPDSHREIHQGEEVWFSLKLLNLANDKRIDVKLIYEIKDSNNNIISSKSETVAIETQASFVRQLKIPEKSIKGKYIIYAKVIYPDNNEISAKSSFNVLDKSENNFLFKYMIMILFLISIIIIIIIMIKRSKPIIENMKLKSKIHDIVKKRNKR